MDELLNDEVFIIVYILNYNCYLYIIIIDDKR